MIRNTNTVILYLKCTFASDITDISSGLILDDMIHGIAPRITSEIYPAQERPSDVAFKDWRHTIYASFIHSTDGIRKVGIPTPAIPRSVPSAFADFVSFLKLQSNPVRGIIGNGLADYTENELKSFATSLTLCDGISVFGDGSVKDGRGAHATRIYASTTFLESESFIETSAITTSDDPVTITSLRSKTYTTLSGLYLLHLIKTHFKIALMALENFYYDNKESLRRLNTLKEFSS